MWLRGRAGWKTAVRRSSDGGCYPLCSSPEEGGHEALLVFACPCLAASFAAALRQQSLELEPLGLHIPLAVLRVLPEQCFDKRFRTQPAQLGSLAHSSRWQRLLPCRAVLPREELGTPAVPSVAAELWGGLRKLERGLEW